MRALLVLAFSSLILGCSKEKFADPVAQYQKGELHSCAPDQKVTIRTEPADITVALTEDEVGMVYTWASQRFANQREFPTGGIIFLHETPKPDHAPDALFNYYLLKKEDGKYCYNGGVNGTTPFNQQLLDKYGK